VDRDRPGRHDGAAQFAVPFVKELVDYAKAHPGELNYASLGIGSSGHLATTLFSDLAGIKVQHVPYTSSARP
jgi:Uncharacterized protein conserved in bacteria